MLEVNVRLVDIGGIDGLTPTQGLLIGRELQCNKIDGKTGDNIHKALYGNYVPYTIYDKWILINLATTNY